MPTAISKDPDSWADVYRSGDTVAVVHKREGGEIFFHEQKIQQEFVPFSQFYRMPAERFEVQLEEHDAETVEDLSIFPFINSE